METKSWNTLYGAIIGDICGSIYEFNNFKTDKPEKINLINDECYFTDDTVCTAAIADSVKPLLEYMQPPCPNSAEGLNGQLRNRLEIDYGIALWNWGNKYPEPERSYGSRFWQWLQDPERKPYGSYGNGAAMRISPIAWLLFEHYRQNPPGSMMGQEFRVSCYDKILRREVEEAEIAELIDEYYGKGTSKSLGRNTKPKPFIFQSVEQMADDEIIAAVIGYPAYKRDSKIMLDLAQKAESRRVFYEHSDNAND